MTTKRKPIRRVTEFLGDTDDDEPKERPAFEFDPAEESFSQFRSKFGTEGVLVKIYRRTPRGVQYCFSGVPSEIDEEVVRLYHAKQAYASEEGQYAARCYVNGEARDSFPILIGPQLAAPGSDPHGGMAGQNDVVKLLLAQNERMEARLNSMSQVEREPLSSLADAMLKLQQLQPKQDLPIDTIMKAIELGKQMGGGSEGSEWMPLAKEVLSQAGPLLSSLLGNLGARPRPAATETAAVIAAPEGGNMQADDEMLRPVFVFLKRKCLAGGDPGLYIDVVIDNRDEVLYQKLIHAVLTREFSDFAAIDPEIQKPPYDKYFRFIHDGLRSAFSKPDPVAADTGGEGGNASDVTGNGKPRKAGGKKS